VVQFFGSSSSKASGFLVGSKVSIKRSFKTASGNAYDTAFGIGSTQITKGSVVATCEGNADTVRPRTSIGWDDYGNVYVATTTMGRDWPDGGQGGYRLGGSTVHQLADWLRDQGATNAVSLDGGGSTTMLAKLEGTYRRADLPDGVWIRWIPMGVALIAR
jgi:exopolysaccharide biosynthesis protein